MFNVTFSNPCKKSIPPTLALPLDGGRCEKIDLVLFHVIPAKAGIQCFQILSNFLDPGFHRGDG
jgi:hypothetical protein